jgi:two-component system alkaline phosphatase synthesis response regulator PhoP
MNKLQILILEDEINLGVTLYEYLESKGYDCKHAKSCQEARDIFNLSDFSPVVILADIGLPDGNGIELAKELRSIRQDFVLLFLSAQNDAETKLRGLEMGAEDYITKPFDLRELMLRLNKALTTHSHLTTYQSEIQLGQLKIRFKSYEVVSSDGTITALGQKECAILELLYKNSNQVVSRDTIIDEIWGEDSYPSNRTVDNYIVKLRKWIDTDTTKKVSIKSIRSVGYQLEVKKDSNE